MRSRFDWRAEDESKWGDLEPDKGTSSPGRIHRRRLVIIVTALLAIVAGSGVVLGRVEKLLDESSGDAEQAVLAAHDLVLSAAAEGDSELLRDLILDRLHEWTDAQVLLAEEGLLLDRRPFNLYLLPAAAPESVSLDLSASLSQAQVSADYRYRMEAIDSRSDSVVLRQLFNYRHEDDQWLLDPPSGAFWGPRQTTSGRYLTLNYLQRDQQLARRLAADFEGLVGQACHSIAEINCPADLHLSVDMVSDPAKLVELSDPASSLRVGLNVKLPSPTLLGVPVDESGYRALYRAYAARIVTALIGEQAEMTCCEPGLLGIALSELILSRLGIMSWPLEIGATQVNGQDVQAIAEALWKSDPRLENDRSNASWQSAYLLVEFLATSWSAVPPAEMLRLQTQASSPQEWLVSLASTEGETSLNEAWRRFVAQYNAE
ncbi:MAG: hypothetical protein JSW55_11570 [Chloroflexota bacterium]|nr:MAG: hypothetical protein JSW55_11570 [Chloroflexota bacterium]